jgi:protein-glutamine gamma-glutamyltransferase
MNRIAKGDDKRLTVRNIYALPTKAGWMMLVTVAILMLATINYQLNLGYLLIFLLMGSGVVGLYLAYHHLSTLHFRLDTSQQLKSTAGAVAHVRLLANDDVYTLTHHFSQMGLQTLPAVVIETRYPLGLIRMWSIWRIASKIQIDEPDAGEGHYAHTAQTTVSAQLDHASWGDARGYRVGDSPRDLLWKTVAKRPDTPQSWGVRESDKSAQTHISASTAQRVPPSRNGLQANQDKALQPLALHRDLLLLGILGFITLPFFLHLSWLPVLLACSLISWRAYLVPQPIQCAPKWLQLPLIVGLGLLVWFQFRTLSGIEPSVTLCIGLLGIKALELPKSLAFSRDHWVLTYLALFTLAAHFLLSQSLLSSVFVVLGLIALIYWLVMSHDLFESASSVRKTTLRLVLWGAPIMAVLFFLFPRFPPLWTLQTQNTARMGLSSQLNVGEIGQLAQDNRIALRMQVDPLAKLASQDIYLRGFVLEQFDGRTWRAIVTAPKDRPLLLETVGDTVIDYTLMIEAGEKVAQKYKSSTAQNTPARQTAWGLPSSSNPRTRQWIQGLQANAQYKNQNARQWSDTLMRQLRTGNYQYNLEPGTYGVHVTDELLFDRKLGFCEHYATSYVIAMRMLDIPARVVTGYQGAEINPLDGLFVVRNGNAHAWAEYWDDASGWVRVDPTTAVAPARISNAEAFIRAPAQVLGQESSLLSTLASPVMQSLWRIRQSWEATSHAWEDWLLDYNQSAQMSWLKSLGFDNPNWKDLVQLLDAALIALLALGTAIYLWLGKSRQDLWVILLQAARDKGLQAGLAIPTSVTPRVLAAQIPKHWIGRESLVHWLIQLEMTRYGKTKLATDIATLMRTFKRLPWPKSS